MSQATGEAYVHASDVVQDRPVAWTGAGRADGCLSDVDPLWQVLSRSRPIVLVSDDQGGTLGIINANGLLDQLAHSTGETSR